MSIKLIFLVGIGGGLGSVLRYILSTLFIGFTPWVTVFINIVGGFMIGILYRYTEEFAISEQIRAFGVIGICGGFTTFSTFGLDFFILFRQEQTILGIFYISISVIGTIAAVFLGTRIFS
tara:strand:- start:297 stop:656 length:360 start_codon:yes stop_codon:yes gene_type:complete